MKRHELWPAPSSWVQGSLPDLGRLAVGIEGTFGPSQWVSGLSCRVVFGLLPNCMRPNLCPVNTNMKGSVPITSKDVPIGGPGTY